MPSLQFNIISNTLVFVLLTDAWLSENFSYMYMDQVILETLSPVYQISQQCFNTDTTGSLQDISKTELFGFPIFWRRVYLMMKIIPKTCRKYLRSYCIIIII